jgi:hypothetical protein
MRIFDHVDAVHLEAREWHLWLLALTVISILAVGTALLMYPSAFTSPLVLAGEVQRKAFFGFCTLCVLVLGYLVDRQMVIRNLRKQIDEERNVIMRVRQKSSADLLQSLPGPGHFQDQLTMEHRRAVSAGHPLSAVLLVVTPTQERLDPIETSIAFGDAAKALLSKLRGEDSIFLLNAGVFCTLLPGVEEKSAYGISERLAEGLRDASGVSQRFSFDIQTFNYPEGFKSAHEIESALRPFLPNAATPHAA